MTPSHVGPCRKEVLVGITPKRRHIIHINSGFFTVINLPFLPACFHLFSHQLKYFEGALWAP